MAFINVIVHSAENLNFRVHLQHEFTMLGLDEHLEVRECVLYSKNSEYICVCVKA